MVSTTVDRVEEHTARPVIARNRARTFAHVRHYREHTEEIPARLAELRREWDVERTLETSSTALTIAGLVLGATLNKRWLLLSAAAQAFCVQHALQGWSPPLALLRRLGLRSLAEIEQERLALEALQLRTPSISGLA